MKYLVGDTPMEQGSDVAIFFSDGGRLNAVYKDTYGYNHHFQTEDGKTVVLSNHFMRLKGIKIKLRVERGELGINGH